MKDLSDDLKAIYDLEIKLGNEVARIDRPAGTKCSFAVIFKRPLHKADIDRRLALEPSVKFWESRDSHYPEEAGFYSEISGHAIAGPIRAPKDIGGNSSV